MAADLMLAISNIAIPALTTYTVSIMDISNAGRNAKGTLIIERVATKRKIGVECQYISAADLSTILNLVKPTLFPCVYIDPEEGTLQSGTFYSGDRSVEGIRYKDGVMYWKNLKFDIIEQ